MAWAQSQHLAVLLRSGDAQPPLFVFDLGDDDFRFYREIAEHLDAGIPIYGLCANGTTETDDSPCSIETLAWRFLAAIREIQPKGPYRLLGHSFGGLVAYEAGSRLIADDESVTFVGLIEAEQGTASLHDYAVWVRNYCPYVIPASCEMFTLSHRRESTNAINGACAQAYARLSAAASAGRATFEDLGSLAEAIDRRLRHPVAKLSRAPKPFDPLIALRAGDGGGIPVFVVPGAGANVAYFWPLAEELPRSSAVYGLQPRGLDGEQLPYASVQAMARLYVDRVRAIARPSDPIRLIGHSFGGSVAYQMATLLRAESHPLDTLILLDSTAPGAEAERPGRYAPAAVMRTLVDIMEEYAGTSLIITDQQLRALTFDEQIGLLYRRMVTHKLLSARASAQTIFDMVRVFKANFSCGFRPGTTYPGSVLSVFCEQDQVGGGGPPHEIAAWRRYAPNCRFASSAGGHMTMLKEANAAQLAAIIRSAWEYSG